METNNFGYISLTVFAIDLMAGAVSNYKSIHSYVFKKRLCARFINCSLRCLKTAKIFT